MILSSAPRLGEGQLARVAVAVLRAREGAEVVGPRAEDAVEVLLQALGDHRRGRRARRATALRGGERGGATVRAEPLPSSPSDHRAAARSARGETGQREGGRGLPALGRLVLRELPRRDVHEGLVRPLADVVRAVVLLAEVRPVREEAAHRVVRPAQRATGALPLLVREGQAVEVGASGLDTHARASERLADVRRRARGEARACRPRGGGSRAASGRSWRHGRARAPSRPSSSPRCSRAPAWRRRASSSGRTGRTGWSCRTSPPRRRTRRPAPPAAPGRAGRRASSGRSGSAWRRPARRRRPPPASRTRPRGRGDPSPSCRRRRPRR